MSDTIYDFKGKTAVITGATKGIGARMIAQVWGDEKKTAPVKARIPLGRFVMPKEISAAVLFLASEGTGMIHGETLVIDGGVNAKLY